jgi:hypothetical protein
VREQHADDVGDVREVVDARAVARGEVLHEIAAGEADIVVARHAVCDEAVEKRPRVRPDPRDREGGMR